MPGDLSVYPVTQEKEAIVVAPSVDTVMDPLEGSDNVWQATVKKL